MITWLGVLQNLMQNVAVKKKTTPLVFRIVSHKVYASQQAKIETAKNMLNDNLDIHTILKYTDLSVEDIKSLAK
ncbi:MAG: hypothetical protein E7064_01260 [Spirochaetaceae bacterium]|nr:hypothetical protein [Spirochaetaceae bacterium]